PARRAARVLLARAGPGAARGAGAAGRPAGDGAGALAPGARWQRAHAAAAAGKAVGAAAAPPGAGAGRAPGRLRPARDRPTVRRTPRGAGVRQRLLPGPFRPGPGLAETLSAAAADYSSFVARQARRGWPGAQRVAFHNDPDMLLPEWSFVPLWIDGSGYWL